MTARGVAAARRRRRGLLSRPRSRRWNDPPGSHHTPRSVIPSEVPPALSCEGRAFAFPAVSAGAGRSEGSAFAFRSTGHNTTRCQYLALSGSFEAARREIQDSCHLFRHPRAVIPLALRSRRDSRPRLCCTRDSVDYRCYTVPKRKCREQSEPARHRPVLRR
jgi:hypothetical protein